MIDRDDNDGSPEVGYRKPPREHCFKPGECGNPKGRPKGSKNKPRPIDDWRCDDIVLGEAFRPVKVRENGRVVEMPLYRASTRAMALQAAAGNTRAARNFHYIVDAAMRRRHAIHEKYREEVAQYVIEARATIAERLVKKMPIDDIHPHPDDVRWDEESGLPYFLDPAEEFSLVEHRNYLGAVDKLIENIEKDLAKAQTENERTRHRGELARLRSTRETINRKITRQERQQGIKKDKQK